ncbi:MAG: DUF5103 domain-containing protein, partial [Duncaniella sp.]|nr:DUF5103 domain-containing protein [Duncaniella sp.]
LRPMAFKRCLAALVLLGLFAVGRAEATDTSQAIFDPAFRSLKVMLDANEFAPPVITLGDPLSRLTVSFDELGDERRFMRYELIHCDALWQPEGLVASEFLDGFNEGTVEDYDFSRATLVHYVHYSITIPNREIRITETGNYLLRVYDESNPDETLLQARFGVSDFSAGVYAGVTSLTDIDTNRNHQQLGLTVDLQHVAGVDDPFNDLRIVVSQNGRDDNVVVMTAPQRVLGDKVIYEHLRPLIFKAGNEYRRFETVSTSYPGMGVENISTDTPIYNMWLYTDTPRGGMPYSYDSTQHGRFFVREASSSRSDTEADYVMVHFSLEMPEIAGADVFLDGDFVQRRFDPVSRMVYNRASGRYENSMMLKQGAYNYQYLTVPSGSLQGETAPVEGDFYQTVNEYTVRVYHRPRGGRFDRLIGVGMIASGN